MIIVKIYLGISLELLWAMWGQFSVKQFLDPACTCSQGLQVPFQCTVTINCRIFICCTCHFQRGSLFFVLPSAVCKFLQCLTSALTEGGEGGHLFRLTCSIVYCKQISRVCLTDIFRALHLVVFVFLGSKITGW